MLGFLFMLTLLSSCGGDSKEAQKGMKALQGIKDIASNAGNVDEQQKALEEMSPLSGDDFLEWAPASVIGLPKKQSTEKVLAFEKYNYSGYNTYYKENGKSIQLEVFDGAGSNVYRRYASMLSTDAMNQERENYYEKNIERDGMMVNEWYDSKNNASGLLFIIQDRFVVSIKADGFSPDEVWDNLEDFKLDEL